MLAENYVLTCFILDLGFAEVADLKDSERFLPKYYIFCYWEPFGARIRQQNKKYTSTYVLT